MENAVKRNYSSTLRESQARATRRQIVDAAADLFAREGYGATTIDAVAAAAGVSRKTVNTVENAVFVPSTVIALKLARALGEPVEALFSLSRDD